MEAQAAIDGNDVVVSAVGVAEPKAVRCAWSQIAVPNLMNREVCPPGRSAPVEKELQRRRMPLVARLTSRRGSVVCRTIWLRRIRQARINRWVALLGVTAVTVYLSWKVLEPFVEVLILGIALTIIFQPVHRRFVKWTGGHRLAAVLSTLSTSSC